MYNNYVLKRGILLFLFVSLFACLFNFVYCFVYISVCIVLQPEGSLAVDRFKSLQKRNIIEPREVVR